MAEQQLDGADVGARFQQVDGEGMSQRMGRDRFANATKAMGPLASFRYGVPADMPVRNVAGKEPVRGPFHAPPIAQDLQQSWGEHDVAIFLSLTLLDPQHHPRTINGRDCELNCFRDAQAGGVATAQNRAMLIAGDATEKLKDFVRTEHYGEGLGLFRSGDDVVETPIFLERHFVKETKRRYGDQDGSGGQLSFVGQIDLVGPNFFRP